MFNFIQVKSYNVKYHNLGENVEDLEATIPLADLNDSNITGVCPCCSKVTTITLFLYQDQQLNISRGVHKYLIFYTQKIQVQIGMYTYIHIYHIYVCKHNFCNL